MTIATIEQAPDGRITVTPIARVSPKNLAGILTSLAVEAIKQIDESQIVRAEPTKPTLVA